MALEHDTASTAVNVASTAIRDDISKPKLSALPADSSHTFTPPAVDLSASGGPPGTPSKFSDIMFAVRVPNVRGALIAPFAIAELAHSELCDFGRRAHMNRRSSISSSTITTRGLLRSDLDRNGVRTGGRDQIGIGDRLHPNQHLVLGRQETVDCGPILT